MKIYHNPKCGTSRNVLAMIRESGIEPEVIEYLKSPPSRQEFLSFVKDAGATVHDFIRQKGTPYEELGLSENSSDAELLDAYEANPILLNRPVVISDKGTRLCRPSEVVKDLLPKDIGAFTKEDGEIV